ncbi:MAG: SAM-dependent chlorinase/fluorinase [bacterium]|nr:SAM-dependent chlorinase/fluorinase [bacterium]
MKKRIVIITDCSDVAYNELRGIVFRLIEESNYTEELIVEPVVSVKEFSLINGSFILRLMAEAYPPGTFFLVILNPLKKRPERIFGKTRDNDFVFMGANTGVFDWFLKDFGLKELYELHDPGFLPFGGKYVHVPSIVRLAMGKPFSEMGKPFNHKHLARLELNDGVVVPIDNMGLIKFIGGLPLAQEGDKFKVNAGGTELVATYAKRMMSYETGDWMIYPGSSLGLPELGKVRHNGARELELNVGDKITFERIL